MLYWIHLSVLAGEVRSYWISHLVSTGCVGCALGALRFVSFCCFCYSLVVLLSGCMCCCSGCCVTFVSCSTFLLFSVEASVT